MNRTYLRPNNSFLSNILTLNNPVTLQLFCCPVSLHIYTHRPFQWPHPSQPGLGCSHSHILLVCNLSIHLGQDKTFPCRCCCHEPVRQCLHGDADASKRQGTPTNLNIPEMHLRYLWTCKNGADVLHPILDTREVNIQLSPPSATMSADGDAIWPINAW